MATGFLGTVIGIVRMLSQMDDPSSIGAGMALCLLSELYGVILAIASCVAAMIVARRGKTDIAHPKIAKSSIIAAAGITVMGVVGQISFLMIILVSLPSQ